MEGRWLSLAVVMGDSSHSMVSGLEIMIDI